MTAIFTNKTDLTPSDVQDAAGTVALTASGTFSGAALIIEVRGDSQGWAPLHRFTEPAAVSVALVTGQQWRASLERIGAGTSISLSAIAA